MGDQPRKEYPTKGHYKSKLNESMPRTDFEPAAPVFWRPKFGEIGCILQHANMLYLHSFYTATHCQSLPHVTKPEFKREGG
jgi:hypothetical protein